MLFKDFYQKIAIFDSQFATDVEWAISTNVEKLTPLHLIELTEPTEKAKYPKFSTIAPGTTNPKTAKHPLTPQTYLGGVLHLTPYVTSDGTTCPWATAIYHITAKDLDPQTLKLVESSPSYENNDSFHRFYGFEIRLKDHGALSDTKQECPIIMKVKLPGINLRDWDSGPTITLHRNQIVKTELVGGCANACLHTAGNPSQAKTKMQGRSRKTEELFANAQNFLSKILLDLFRLEGKAKEQGHQSVVRLNATSDISWESDFYRFPSDPRETESILQRNWPKGGLSKQYLNIIKNITNSNATNFLELISDVAKFVSGKTVLEILPNTIYYDYTKDPSRMMKFLRAKKGKSSNWPSNYYLTFSLSERNREAAKRFLKLGGTVAAVFNVMKVARAEHPLPKTWAEFQVVDGDKHDYRFLDEPGVVIGLRAKGEAKFKTTDFGFVIQPDDPDLDPNDPAVIQAKQYVANFERRRRSGELTLQPGDRRKRFIPD